ncbi:MULTISPECIES: hypothetical protein [unclassified Streptomyces]|uniref:hypothetical protein n=1 Tax=unclassified Streptomyces TaxID=2593676 RepID=UPI00081B9D62|nr:MULTISPECIES: hypothetical protein [unclassified Streptomyces]MYQ55320.1 hypothetical protein [Streptomyces sp. SID4941]SCE36116.1 hypothetical protein GA0115247_133723 [Streptomyces sp. PalvLS-984]SDD72403.1 hypothetical protein F558DRAFT_04709 [Streptomyces sp. AmelKG-A3]
MARQGITAAYGVRRQGVVDAEIAGIAMECRDDLLEAAVVLDALALCHGHGCQETNTPVPRDVELRTDASDVAGELARHDRQYGTGMTGGIPAPLEEGCTDCDQDAVRRCAQGMDHPAGRPARHLRPRPEGAGLGRTSVSL